MGMDIYSETGVLADIDDMVGMLRKKDVKPALEALADYFDNAKPEEMWTQSKESFTDFFEPLRNLQQMPKPTVEDVAEALRTCCQVNGEPSKYGSDDCFVHWAEAVQQIWSAIIEATRPELPDLTEVRVFDSGRVNGWDVPHGIACFVFSANECFEQKLTEEGKKLKRAIGHCNSSEWTIMSV